MLAATALVAAAYFIVTFLSNRKATQLKDAQAAVIRAKDEQLAGDLKDRDLRIAEAGSNAAQANEKARTLEHANLILRNDLNEAAGKVAAIQKDAADAQKDAADAKAAQQRVEVEWAKQKERAAIAERALLELQERIKPRRISMEQRTRLVEMLKQGPKGPVDIACVLGDGEGLALAGQIDEVLKTSGWLTSGVSQGVYAGGNPVGVGILVRDARTAPSYAAVLQRAFGSVAIPLGGAEKADLPEGKVVILVGSKP